MSDHDKPDETDGAAPRADGLKATPLTAAHRALGARMVPFAGYEMPLQYEGVMAEHRHTRAHAGLFDISHMGQILVEADDAATLAAALERLVPADLSGLAPGRSRYTMLLNDEGGIIDDLILTRLSPEGAPGRIFAVVNAARREADLARLEAGLPPSVRLTVLEGRALLALQGPEAAAVLSAHVPSAAGLGFMEGAETTLFGHDAVVCRSGYTGEDGFEISLPADAATGAWQRFLADGRVKPVGLGARDSLRLEAGLCLYGNDIDETTSPVEAALEWSIGKRRRAGGGFPGAERIHEELAGGPARRRVGIRPHGRVPARAGTEILSAAGQPVGTVTSGGFGATVNGPVAMGYVAASHATPGTPVTLVVRGKAHPAEVATLPFVPRGRPAGAGSN